MNDLVDTCMVVTILAAFVVLGSSRLRVCIRAVAVQGVVLGLVPVLAQTGGPAHAWFLALATVALKGLVFPLLLLRALRSTDIRREVEPFIGFTASLLAGAGLLGLAFWMAGKLPPLADPAATMCLAAGLFVVLCGFLVIVTRRKALTQVLGYLILENGVVAVGLAVAPHQSAVVELGILLDVFVAVFIAGIAVFHIGREFEHMDVDRLTSLRDWRRVGGRS